MCACLPTAHTLAWEAQPQQGCIDASREGVYKNKRGSSRAQQLWCQGGDPAIRVGAPLKVPQLLQQGVLSISRRMSKRGEKGWHCPATPA
jgi:hypothetical protein